MPIGQRSTERIIGLLKSVNATAVNNDDGRPGEFLAELCREAAEQLHQYHEAFKNRSREIDEAIYGDSSHPDCDVARLPRMEDELGCDINHDVGC